MGRTGDRPWGRQSRLSVRLRRPAGPASSASFPRFLSRLLGAAALLVAGAAGLAAPAAADVMVSNLASDDGGDRERSRPAMESWRSLALPLYRGRADDVAGLQRMRTPHRA